MNSEHTPRMKQYNFKMFGKQWVRYILMERKAGVDRMIIKDNTIVDFVPITPKGR